MNPESRRTLAIGFLQAVALTFLVLIAWRCGAFQALELVFYDCALRLQNQSASSASFETRVVVLGLTEADIRRFGWPMSDRQLASALTRLSDMGASVIGLDLYRDLPEPRTGEQHHELQSVLKGCPQIIAIYGIGSRTGPPPALAELPDRIGFNDLPADTANEKVVRRGLIFMDTEREKTVASFAFQIARVYLRSAGIWPEPDPFRPEWMKLGHATFRPFESNDGGYVGADSGGYQFLIDGRGPRVFPTFSMTTLEEGIVPVERVRGRIVMIGVTADSVRDVVDTPFREIGYGVELHAQLVDQLVRSAMYGDLSIRHLPEWMEALWITGWGATGALVGWSARTPWHLAVRFGYVLASVLACYWLSFLRGWWVPVVAPSGAMLAATLMFNARRAWCERSIRKRLMQLFGRYVSDDIARWIWHEERVAPGEMNRRPVDATILFADLKGYTSIAEQLPPEVLVPWLNDFLETMADAVRAHSGIVNKFIGDAIMAVFGIPNGHQTESEKHEVNAVECALAMEQALVRLNVRWAAGGLPQASMRIGIFTGSVMAGSVGSINRMEFTVLGDPVNTAARLENLDQRSGDPDQLPSRCRILVGEPTRCSAREGFQFAEIGSIFVKGKRAPVNVYRVIGRRGADSAVARAIGRVALAVLLMSTSAPELSSAPERGFPHGSRSESSNHLRTGNRRAVGLPTNAPNAAVHRTNLLSGKRPSESKRLMPVYVPPQRGAPRVRVNAGSRGPDAGLAIDILAPDHPAFTARSHPVLYGYLNVPAHCRIEFALAAEDEPEPLLEIIWESHPGGAIRIDTAEWDVELVPERIYRCSFALVPDPARRSKDTVAAGVIQRVLAGQAAIAESVGEEGGDAVTTFAAAGLWYDAIDAALEELSRAPESEWNRTAVSSLLEQAGLIEIVGGIVPRQ